VDEFASEQIDTHASKKVTGSQIYSLIDQGNERAHVIITGYK
jgi:hypothetical protein